MMTNLFNRMFPTRILGVFLLWVASIFTTIGNVCLLFLRPDLPRVLFSLLIVAFPTSLLGVTISNVSNSNAVRWVILALLFELLILLFLSGQMILE
ncbi:MAG: hypothetical protein P8O04_07340 [Flavobacteriaceae bacterium]|nr:hypothetical protein [Flavobacteriaceae bacterium]